MAAASVRSRSSMDTVCRDVMSKYARLSASRGVRLRWMDSWLGIVILLIVREHAVHAYAPARSAGAWLAFVVTHVALLVLRIDAVVAVVEEIDGHDAYSIAVQTDDRAP